MEPAPAEQPSSMQGGIFDGLAVGSKAPAQAQPPQSDSLLVAESSASIAVAADMFGGLSLSGPGQSSTSGAGQMSADPFGVLTAPNPGPASAGEHFLLEQSNTLASACAWIMSTWAISATTKPKNRG